MEIRRGILIVGGAGWSNVGDDLIAQALVDWVQSNNERHFLAGGPFDHNLGKSLKIQSDTFARAVLALNILRARHVVIGGGGLLDDRMPNFYRPFTRIARLCRLFRTPYSFVGIGVGPIRRPDTATAYVEATKYAAHVMVRDEQSATSLREAGLSRPIEVVADPVMWTPRQPVSAPSSDLIINLRHWQSAGEIRDDYNGPNDEEIIRAVADAVNAVFPSHARVLLVSMSGSPENVDSDAVALERLRPLLAQRVETLYDLDPRRVEQAVAGTVTVLAMRLHPCLLGASYGRRVVGLVYDPKVAAQATVYGFRAELLDASEVDIEHLASSLRYAPQAALPSNAPRAPWLP